MRNPVQAWRDWTAAEQYGVVLYVLALLTALVPGAIAHSQHAASLAPLILR